MYLCKQAWRWYGPDDPVGLWDIRQAGATGRGNGVASYSQRGTWSVDERSANDKADGCRCRVGMERRRECSGPMSGSKPAPGEFQRYIENYKQSLRNLAACGIRTVTYNFMPVLDWTRTDLAYTLPDGSKALVSNGRRSWRSTCLFCSVRGGGGIYVAGAREGGSTLRPDGCGRTRAAYPEHDRRIARR